MMIDWTAPMQQTYEFYIVDPRTWKDKEQIRTITKGSIKRDSSAETKGSASFETTEMIEECYVRTYLRVNQNGESRRYPLGTHLVQTPEKTYDGRVSTQSMDAYTPLLELKDNVPPLGYTILGGSNILDISYGILRGIIRAPVVKSTSYHTIGGNFVSEINDTWLKYLTDFIANANYELDIDEMGRILFSPVIDIRSMQPVYTFNDDNSSILQPSITISRDLYGVPNVVEAVYSQDEYSIMARAENNDPNSPVSIPSRGREVVARETDPDLPGTPTPEVLQSYADGRLRDLSSLEYTVSYTHGYLPTVRVGDCVRLNYERAGLTDVKAKVINQSISLESGCQVEETAVFTKPVMERKKRYS